MEFIKIPFGYLLAWLYDFTANYGIALILFSLILKFILLPMNIKSKKSMRAMSKVQPQMQALQKKYANDPQKQNEMINKLYKDEGVSMGGGCLWSFLPLFILFPLYAVVRQPITYMLHESLDVAAQRVKADASRGSVENYESLEDAKQKLKKRAETEDARYKEIYGIEYFNMANYNLILDSTDCEPAVLAQILADEARAYEVADSEGKGGYTKLILSLNRPEEDFSKEKAEGNVTKEVLHGVEFLVVTLNK